MLSNEEIAFRLTGIRGGCDDCNNTCGAGEKHKQARANNPFFKYKKAFKDGETKETYDEWLTSQGLPARKSKKQKVDLKPEKDEEIKEVQEKIKPTQRLKGKDLIVNNYFSCGNSGSEPVYQQSRTSNIPEAPPIQSGRSSLIPPPPPDLPLQPFVRGPIKPNVKPVEELSQIEKVRRELIETVERRNAKKEAERLEKENVGKENVSDVIGTGLSMNKSYRQLALEKYARENTPVYFFQPLQREKYSIAGKTIRQLMLERLEHTPNMDPSGNTSLNAMIRINTPSVLEEQLEQMTEEQQEQLNEQETPLVSIPPPPPPPAGWTPQNIQNQVNQIEQTIPTEIRNISEGKTSLLDEITKGYKLRAVQQAQENPQYNALRDKLLNIRQNIETEEPEEEEWIGEGHPMRYRDDYRQMYLLRSLYGQA